MPEHIDYEIPIKYYKNPPVGFSPLFTVNGAVLAESWTGKRYTYCVIDSEHGTMTHLYHSKIKLQPSRYGEIAAKMSERGLIPDEPLPKKKTELENLTDKLNAIFIGILPLYGYAVRDKQIELAIEMLEALYNGRIAIAEAEVGTGKTHAYILASLFVKKSGKHDFHLRSTYPLSREFHCDSPMPIVISTSSIALQKAITQDYIPEISRILLNCRLIKKPLVCVIRKGKDHYVCERRLNEFLRDIKGSEIEQLLRTLADKSKRTIDLDALDSVPKSIKQKICVSNQCNPSCPYHGDCLYMDFLSDAKSYRHDFQVCNHNYLLADIFRRNMDGKFLLPNYQAVIIDEAHKFLQAARQMYGTELSNTEIIELSQLITDLRIIDRKTKQFIHSYCQNLMKSNKELFKALLKGVPKANEYDDDAERFETVIGRHAKNAIRCLLYNAEKLTEYIADPSILGGRNKALQSYALWKLRDICKRAEVFINPDMLVYWLKVPKLTRSVTGETVLSCIPKSLDKTLFEDLWCKPVPLILTSGTLSAGGDFQHIRKSMGLDFVKHDRLTETSKPSPFNHWENTLLYISETTPFPDNKNPDYIKAVADEVEHLVRAAHGHTAVLFTSYKVMELVFDMLRDANTGYQLFKLDRGGLNAIELFRKSGSGVLFASGSLWEGIDLPGDVLSMLIIVKLPFAVPDPVSKYEQGLYANMDEYKQHVITPEMLLKLKQGFGRLIRTETDTGVMALLDYRARCGGVYRQRMLDALPECRVTDSIDEVERFIREKKDRSYFS